MTEGVTAAWVKAQRVKASAPVIKRPAPTRKEREIQRAILDYLKVVPGVVAWRTNSGAAMLPRSKADGSGTWMPVRFGFKGLSDIVGWVSRPSYHNTPGCMPRDHVVAAFLAIEVKREGKYPTEEQAGFLRMVQRAGGLAIVARNVDDVRRGLGL